MQDDIAQSVVKELRTTLMGEAADAKAGPAVTAQVAAAVKGRASNAEAHRLYLQARHFLDRITRDDTAKAIDYLKQALGLDPAFALAWAELGNAYTKETSFGWTPETERYARAREAVGRALALEADLAGGHAQMGLIQVSHWDWCGAEASYRRALELAPGNAVVLRRAGMTALNLGRIDEAIALSRRAVEQDPLNASSYNMLGIALDKRGRLADAEAAYRKALELAPQRAKSRANLALNLLAQGRGAEALAEVLREPLECARLWVLALIEWAAGRLAESEAALQELIAKCSAHEAYQVAMVYAARDEADLAFAWLEQAYVQRDGGLAEVKLEPRFRSLQADPRWDTFVRKMGFPE